MSIKNIFLVSTVLSGKGGMETVIRDFCAGMEAQGVTVKVFFLSRIKPKKHSTSWLSGLDYKVLVPSPIIPSFVRKVIEVQKLAALINCEKPDACIALNFGAIERLNSARKKTYFFKIISWIHFSLKITNKPWLIKKADYHLAISSGIAEELTSMLGIAPEKVATIYNPLPNEVPTCVGRPSDGTSSFLFIGRLTAQKNPKLLVSAFSKLKGNWKLHIVGDGNERPELLKMVKNARIDDKVIFHGWKEDCWKYVSTLGPISALVLTSDNEGLPMVLLEAISRGIFCIAANCETGPADIISPKNGALFPPKDEKALLAELEKVIKQAGKIPISQDVIRRSVQKFALRDYCLTVLKNIENWNKP